MFISLPDFATDRLRKATGANAMPRKDVFVPAVAMVVADPIGARLDPAVSVATNTRPPPPEVLPPEVAYRTTLVVPPDTRKAAVKPQGPMSFGFGSLIKIAPLKTQLAPTREYL